MLRKLSTLLAVICVFFSVAEAQVGQGALKGKIVNEATGEAIPFANVVILQGDIQVGGVQSDFDGNYTIKPIPPGIYVLKATFVGFAPLTINNLQITGDKTTYYDVKMREGVDLKPVDVIYYKDLVEKDNSSTGDRFDAEDIKTLPVRSIGEIQSISAGVVGGRIRGSRAGQSQTFIDGIKVRGSANLPRAAIGEVNIITGGVPAQYGDLTGGVTSITTKGPSAASFTNIELLSSGFKMNDKDEVFGFDNQGYNLVGLTYGGPLLFKRDAEGKKEKPLIGILIASEFVNQVDPRPSSVGNYQAKDDVIARLQNDPLRETGTGSGSVPNSYFLRSDDLKLIDTRRNVGQSEINLSTNLNVSTSKNTTLKFGGTYTREDANFDQRGNGQAFSLLNFDNNPNSVSSTWRAFGRFTQTFNNEADEENENSSSTIKNAFVSFQVDYSRSDAVTQNDRHKDNFFDYGYVGQFIPTRITDELGNYAFRTDTTLDGQTFTGWFYEGPNQTQLDFVPGTKNPVLANYTSDYYSLYRDSTGNLLYEDNYDREDNILTGGGLLNGTVPRNVYDLWTDVGTQFNSYGKSIATQLRVTAQGSADIGKHHEILIGFEYEQRDDRFYSIAPVGLWTIGRQLMNNQIEQLDRGSYTIDRRFGGSFPVITFDRLYDEASQSTFDRNVRLALGLPVDGLDFIDIDSYDPGEFDVSYFSADELLNGGSPLISYAGFDHKGDRLTGNRPTIDDFFTKRNDEGDLTREIPSFQPIYVSGYIQDRFDFDDLIFRVGVRVDRFDANQPVLKDDFSLFPTVLAGDDATGGDHPANIGDDFVVYVSDVGNPRPENIIGYRDLNGNNADIWYDAQGRVVIDPRDIGIGNSEGTAPWLVDVTDNSTVEDLTSASFEDYTPQVTVMPRVSFSFPISDQANFFANYDVLTQRPSTSLQVNPIDYLFLGTRNTVINNPNLRPTKQITYEIGFEQELTRSSAITYLAFYREQRDDIQVVRKFGAYPVSYRTFENIDFGTVKGLTIRYDMRRKKNVRITSNYTLQFANGTGSSSTSQLNLINANNPNLRTIQPTNQDIRHTVNMTVDYTFGTGKAYNGPKWFNKDVFAGAGASFILQTSSGRPYTRSSTITSGGLFSGGQPSSLVGGINGSRLPWIFNLDMRVDKNFQVRLNKESKSQPKFGNMNIYVQVLNLLNTQNILAVYNGTGAAEDDGFLAEPTSQPTIDNQNDPQSFRDLYTAKILNDGFFSVQRRIRLGLQLSF